MSQSNNTSEAIGGAPQNDVKRWFKANSGLIAEIYVYFAFIILDTRSPHIYARNIFIVKNFNVSQLMERM